MAIILPGAGVGGAAAGSVGMAGGATGRTIFPGAGSNDNWDEDDMSYPDSGSAQSQSNGGFTYQGKAYDPILQEPMEVNAEMYADFWEDDMDYSESVSYESADAKTGVQATADEKTCKDCPPEGKVGGMVRRCSRWSKVTINYQTRICDTFYNPETKQIQEYKYCGVSFDGWKDKQCQFWEAKARYDQFFISSQQKKRWWRGDRSAMNQAVRHQTVAMDNQPLKVIWFFMQPISFAYFRRMFSVFKDIIVRYQP